VSFELHHTEPGRDLASPLTIQNGVANHATDIRSPYCRPRHRLFAQGDRVASGGATKVADAEDSALALRGLIKGQISQS
jgi:hypothetical protein